MNKLVLAVAVPAVLGVGWLGATWWTSQQTEALVRQQIEQANVLLEKRQVQGLKEELVSYERGLLGAKAVIRLKVDNPLFSKWLNNLQFEHAIKHGPIILQDGLHFALSDWQSHLNLSQVDAATRQWLATAFAGKAPLEAKTVVGFDREAHSEVQFSPLAFDDAPNGRLKVAKASISADIDTETQAGPFHVQLDGVEFGRDSQTTIPLFTVNGEMRSAQSGQVTLQAKDITFNGTDDANKQKVQVDLNANFDSNEEGDSLNSKGDLTVNNIRLTGIKSLDFTPQQLTLEGDLSGFNLKGLEHIQQLSTETQKIMQQLQPAATGETGEYDVDASDKDLEKTKQAQAALQNLALQMVDVLLVEVLQPGKSHLSYGLKFVSDKGEGSGLVEANYLADGNLQTKTHVQVKNVDLSAFEGSPTKTLKQLNFEEETAGINLQGVKASLDIWRKFDALQKQADAIDVAVDEPETDTNGKGKGKEEKADKVSASEAALAANAEAQTALISELETTLFSKVLQPNKSRLHYALNFAVDQGAGDGTLDVVYTGNSDKPLKFEAFENYTPQDWVKLLNTALAIGVDKAVLPEEMQQMAGIQVEQKLLTEKDNRYALQLKSLVDGQLELNGEKMSVDDLLTRLSQ